MAKNRLLKKARVTFTVDPDVKQRCQALGKWVNWSAFVEQALLQSLPTFELTLSSLVNSQPIEEVAATLLAQAEIVYKDKTAEIREFTVSEGSAQGQATLERPALPSETKK